MSFTQQWETSPQWENYVDLPNDVKPYLQFPVTATTQDVILQGVTDMACTWVQRYLKRPVAPTRFFRRFSGYTGLNGSYIDLPYKPVLGTVTVAEYWGLNSGSSQTDTCTLTNSSAVVQDPNAVFPYASATVTGTGVPAGATILSVVPGVSFTMSAPATTSGSQSLTIQTPGYILQEQFPNAQGAPGAQMFQCDRVTGLLIRSFQGLIQRPFFPGLRNVEVWWTAGYNPVPPDIRFATLEMIKYWWANTQQASRNIRLPEGYDEPQGHDLWPAVPNRIVSLLEPYLCIGIG